MSSGSVDSIYLDYAKAFDKVDHSILIKKLEIYGVTKQYINWIKSFLSGRNQVVFLNNVFSYETEVKSGVPQGSVLGPLLFIIFINDMQEQITYSRILTFADDTKLVHPINSESDKIFIQNDLNSVIKWSQLNNMKLNVNKFELLIHNINSENSDQGLSKHYTYLF